MKKQIKKSCQNGMAFLFALSESVNLCDEIITILIDYNPTVSIN